MAPGIERVKAEHEAALALSPPGTKRWRKIDNAIKKLERKFLEQALAAEHRE